MLNGGAGFTEPNKLKSMPFTKPRMVRGEWSHADTYKKAL